MTEKLFREEAVRHRTRALFGEVVLAGPISTWVITALLFFFFVGFICFGVFGSIELDGVATPIWKWALGISA